MTNTFASDEQVTQRSWIGHHESCHNCNISCHSWWKHIFDINLTAEFALISTAFEVHCAEFRENAGFLSGFAAKSVLVNNQSLICLIQLGELNRQAPVRVSGRGSLLIWNDVYC